MDDRARQQAMDWALNAARKAGQLLVELAAKPLEVETKKDGSSVTNADYASHKIIGSELAASGWPVISEEGVRRPLSERQSWERFWLVDPLDGTSSFIRMRAGYAVNIALIEHDGKDWVPILGVVALPDLNEIYLRRQRLGRIQGQAFRVQQATPKHPGRRRRLTAVPIADQLERKWHSE